jgi:uncharacterized protein (DUF39 family)
MAKTIKEINEKIKNGDVAVVTAEEIVDIVKKKGLKRAAAEVDVVTTGTFGPMCSSGAYLNLGHTKPKIKIGGGVASLNDVPLYTGFAAVDVYMGATAIPDDDPRNKNYPGEFGYGGGHVIEALVAGEDLKFTATAYGTDCYPRKKIETRINMKDVNEAVLFNPRNAYQNYNVAVNQSDKTIYTYMGMLKPRFGNANYCSAGRLSPLLNDPYYRTLGIGTRPPKGKRDPLRPCRDPGRYRGSQTDEARFPERGEHARLRRLSRRGHRPSHTHTGRRDMPIHGRGR